MNIQSQHPADSDLPSLIREVARCLDLLHTSQRVHGGLHGTLLKQCVTPQGIFDEAAFMACASDAVDVSDESRVYDRRAFVECCLRWVAGNSQAPDAYFRADLHRGGIWPVAFLELLEQAQDEKVVRQLGWQDWCAALGLQASEATGVESVTDAAEASAHDAQGAAMEEPSTGATPRPTVSTPPVTTSPAVRLSLRNGTVGRHYRIEPGVIASKIAQACGDAPDEARVIDMDWPASLGLVFDAETGSVEGIPLEVFEGEIVLTYRAAPDAEPKTWKASLLINPDPASLWKELDPPEDAPYARPSREAAEYHYGVHRIVGASRRGRSHANRGEFRDDAFAVGYAASTGWLIVVVADGAGSAKYSRRGAELACEAVKARLTAALNQVEHPAWQALMNSQQGWQQPEFRNSLRQMLYEAALHAHYMLQEEVKSPAMALPVPASLRNFDTTLLILVMRPHSGGQLAATFSIGDGGAGVLTSPQQGHPLTRPEGGEHAGQTTFLTLPATLRNEEANLERRFHLEWLPSVAATVVMTDGITDPKFPSDAAFSDPAAWAALWHELQPALDSPEALLGWMNFFSPGNHDDRTLVAVLPGDSTPATEPS
jgi:hypothetical protein